MVAKLHKINRIAKNSTDFLKIYLIVCGYKKSPYIRNHKLDIGVLAHLARALDWQSKGDEFESRMLHRIIQQRIISIQQSF